MKRTKTSLFSMRIGILLVATGMGMASHSMAREAGPRYATYQNASFGFTVSYPPDLFIPKGESESGDGQRFVSKDGTAEFIAYGRFNTGQPLSQAFQAASSAKERKATYQHLDHDFFVVSGTEGDGLFYEKGIVKGGASYTLLVHYPQSAKNIYDPIVNQLAKSFYIASGHD